MRFHAPAALALAALAVVAGAAAPASAHNFLVSATPAPGSTITAQPGTIEVTTNSALLQLNGTAGFGMLVQDAVGRYYGDGCVAVSGASVSTQAQLGSAGQYTVTWQVVSTDSHPVSNSYVFTWKPDASQELAAGTTAVPDCHGTAQEAPQSASADAGAVDTTVWWIVGGVGALVVAVVVTLVILRPRKRGEADDQTEA